MPHHFFVVRATVSDPSKRQAFDTWYAKEHMPDAVKTFGAEKAWRFWSVTDPAVHQATLSIPRQGLARSRHEWRGDEAADRRLQSRLA